MPTTSDDVSRTMSNLKRVAELTEMADRAFTMLQDAYTTGMAADKLLRDAGPRFANRDADGGGSALEDVSYLTDEVKVAARALAEELHGLDLEPLYRASVAAFEIGNALSEIEQELERQITDDEDDDA